MVAKISDQIAVMKSEIIEQGLADQVLDHPQHPYKALNCFLNLRGHFSFNPNSAHNFLKQKN